MARAVALVTGAARRIGAAIATDLHDAGLDIALHYHTSHSAATQLAAKLNDARENSCQLFPADLASPGEPAALAQAVLAHFTRVDVLVNNASSFIPTDLHDADEAQWNALLGSNLKGPYFLILALRDALAQQRGVVINLLDSHCEKPLPGYSIYAIAKAGAAMMTQSLARELAPQVRVNGIAPGAILWPENTAQLSTTEQRALLQKVPLGRLGDVAEIAASVRFLALEAPFITGQILAVDGGRNLGS